MIYGTYRLPDGSWQAIGAFATEQEARETLEFHAAGRAVATGDSPESVRAKTEAADSDQNG